MQYAMILEPANKMAQYSPRRGIALSFVCLVILGVMPVISNGRPAGSNALIFALYLSFWQFLFAVPLFVRELRSNNRGIFGAGLSPARTRRTLAITVITGVIFGLSTYVYVLAFEKAGAVSAAIALQAYPLFAMVLEAIFLGRRKSRGELFFTILIIIALYYLATGGTWRIDGFSFWSVFALGVPLLWSVAHVALKEVLVTTPITPNQVTFSRLLVSNVFLLLVNIAFDGPGSVFTWLVDADFQAFAILMGLVYYLELIVWFHAVRHVDVSVASSVTVPAPVVTMIFAIIFLSETVHQYQIIAMGVIIAAMYGLLYFNAKKARPQAAEPHFRAEEGYEKQNSARAGLAE